MTELERTRRSGPSSSWVAGVVLGALSGFLLIMFPPLGAILVTVAAILVMRTGRVLPGLGGLLVGLGGMWGLLFGRVKLSCIAEDGCTSPSIDLYIGIGFAVLLVGLVMSFLEIHRSRR
jgi:hypothetical protein